MENLDKGQDWIGKIDGWHDVHNAIYRRKMRRCKSMSFQTGSAISHVKGLNSNVRPYILDSHFIFLSLSSSLLIVSFFSLCAALAA